MIGLVTTCLVRGVPSGYSITVDVQIPSMVAAPIVPSPPPPTRRRACSKSAAAPAKSPPSMHSAYRYSRLAICVSADILINGSGRRYSFIVSVGRQLDSKGVFCMGVLDSFRLDDNVVIVTGASSGLGVAFAQAFAEAGADVVLGARRVDRLAETAALVEAAGCKPLPVATDVSVPAQCQALVDAAIQAFGRVDILINNAGTGSA